MIDIELLSDNESLLPHLARWYFEEWGKSNRNNTLEKEIQKLQIYLNSDKVPLILIAKDKERLVGAAQLKYHEMSIYPEKTYWLGGVYVSKSHRGHGIAGKLIVAMIIKAQELNIEQLYLQTEDLSGGLYKQMGWLPKEKVIYHDVEVLVMGKKLHC